MALPFPSPSPCISVCTVNANSGWCEGCYRTIDEIAAWPSSSEAGRRAIWLRLVQRHEAARYAHAERNQALMRLCRSAAT